MKTIIFFHGEGKYNVKKLNVAKLDRLYEDKSMKKLGNDLHDELLGEDYNYLSDNELNYLINKDKSHCKN